MLILPVATATLTVKMLTLMVATASLSVNVLKLRVANKLRVFNVNTYSCNCNAKF